MTKKLYRLTEALEQLGIGKTKAYEEMAAGRLGFIQYGSSRMFTEDHLDTFVAKISAGGDAA